MSEPVFTFRLATPDDAEVLQAIYAPYILMALLVLFLVQDFHRSSNLLNARSVNTWGQPAGVGSRTKCPEEASWVRMC